MQSLRPPSHPLVADFSTIACVPCPCGEARRGLMDSSNELLSVHETEISENARTHYHREHTETYYFLEGSGFLELDGERQPVHPGMAVLIPPGVRHRAIVAPGERMKILNIVIPPFDPADEWLD
jgi:mannose-6-phosphate isomerase-like protein (cupin superfamily)